MAWENKPANYDKIEKLLGKATCTNVGQTSVECRSGSGGISRIRVGIQTGGFTLEMAPPTQAGTVKYSDLANVLQYGPRSTLLDRFPNFDDMLRLCQAGTGGCAFSSPDSKGPVRRLQIMYFPSTANASASLTVDWSK